MSVEKPKLSPNKALAKRYLTALGALDTVAASREMHDDCVCHFPTIAMRPDTYTVDAMMRFIDSLKEALINGIDFEFVELTEEENRVSVFARGNSTTVDGNSYNNQYHFLLYIKDQKIIRHLEFFDSYLSVKAMGPVMARLAKSRE